MSEFEPIGFGAGPARPGGEHHIRLDEARIALHRVLEFTRHSIDDIINDPIARNEVHGYLRLYFFIERRCESLDQERHWFDRPSGI
jgi:hypothetical protein